MSDIRQWLEQLGLAQYAEAFAAQDVDAGLLLELTDADLEKLGVASLGHRKRILKAIRALPAPAALPPSPVESVQRPAGNSDADTLAPEAERRHLTVMFCDLVGSTALSGKLDPEDLRAVIRGYQSAVTSAVQPFEGYVAQLLGDGVLVYFGYPHAHEDDAARAVRAAVQAVVAVGALSPPGDIRLQIRIGIATGMVVVGRVGDGTPAAETSATGETPNLAARLEGLARPGEIVVAPETRGLVGGAFDFESLGLQTLKGIDKPVEAWRVLGERAVSSRFEADHPHGLAPFVGRESEVSLLLERWAMARDWEGQVVLLSGEAGIGKSRISQALRDRLSDEETTTVLFQCSPYFASSALYPVTQALERMSGFEEGDAPEQRADKVVGALTRLAAPLRPVAAGHLLRLLGLPDGNRAPPGVLASQEKWQRLESLIEFLVGLSAARPLLLLVEDAHWIDPTTEELLALAVDRLRESRVLMLALGRPEYTPSWGNPAHLTKLTLNKLGQKQCAAMIAALTKGKELPGEVMAEIVGKTDGVPLFVEELTKTVIESGVMEETASGYALKGSLPRLAIPATLQDSLAARLDRVTPAKVVAQAASVIGREFSHRLLAAMLDMPEGRLNEALDELVRAELVFRRGTPPEATYNFKHALVRDTAYRGMIRSQRMLRHAQVAAAIERTEPATGASRPELLAYHLQEGGDSAAAFAHWCSAGDLAASRSANQDAATLYRNALAVLPEACLGGEAASREFDLQLKVGTALLVTEGYRSPRVYDAFARGFALARSLGELDLEVATASYLSMVMTFAGRCADAVELFRGLSEDDLQRLSPKGQIGRSMAMGLALSRLGEADGASTHLAAARRALEPIPSRYRRQTGGNDSLIVVLVNQSEVLAYRGLLEQAHATATRALEIAEQENNDTDRAFALQAMAWRSLAIGDADAAIRLLRRMIDLAIRIGYVPMTKIATMLLGYALISRGEGAEGLRTLRAGCEDTQFTTDPAAVIIVEAQIAEALLAVGQVSESREHLTAAEIVQRTSQTRSLSAELIRLRGRLLQCDRDDAMAEASYREAVDNAGRQGAKLFGLRAAADLARLLAGNGRAVEGKAVLAPIYDSFTEGFDYPDLVRARQALQAPE